MRLPNAKKYDTDRERCLATIEKWERIVKALENNDRIIGNFGASSCAFCVEYFTTVDEKRTNCYGCPIAEKVGLKECNGTPFRDFLRALHKGYFAEMEHYAQDEVDLLKDLARENGWLIPKPYQRLLDEARRLWGYLEIKNVPTPKYKKNGIEINFKTMILHADALQLVDLVERFGGFLYLRIKDGSIIARIHNIEL